MKFILITILIVFIFGKVIKYALKYWLMSSLQKAQNKTFNANTAQHQPQSKKEGSIHIDKNQNANTKSKSTQGGEYIDYEIIK